MSDELGKISLDTSITGVELEGEDFIITTYVTGDFKGSLLPFRYSTKLKDGKIDRLDITVAK